MPLTSELDAPEQKKLEGIIIVVNAYRLRYIASFGAYAPPNSKLYFQAVGEPLGVRVPQNRKRTALIDNPHLLVEAA